MSRQKITIPNSSVSENLTGFPMYIDLSSLGDNFWDGLYHDEGYDIRVRDSSDAALNFDLINCNKALKTGSLFVKLDLNTSTDTVIYIDSGNPEESAVGDSYFTTNRNNVWSSYHRVFFFNPELGYIDHSGNGSKPSTVGLEASLIPYLISPELNSHQGFTFDGTYYYVTDNNYIRKFDTSWNVVQSNSNPVGDIGGTVNHLGDPSYYNGVLYIPAENYVSISTFSEMKIARFNMSDLTYISSVDVSAQGHEVSSCCIVPEDSMVYVTSFADGSKLWKYNLSDLTYNSSISLSSTVDKIQGIEYWRDNFWVTSDSTGGLEKRLIRVTKSGTVGETISYSPDGTTSGNLEGVASLGSSLGYLYSTGASLGKIYRLEYDNSINSNGIFFSGISGGGITQNYLLAESVTRYTTWSIGVSAILSSKGQNRSFVSYEQSGSSVNTLRVTIAYRNTSDQIGVWDTDNSWLYSSITPELNRNYRFNAVYDGTTGRYFYTDGSKQSDLTITAKPTTGANALYIGINNADLVEDMHGHIGYVYLRNSVLSDGWIAAESDNLSDPLAFYTVEDTTPEKSISHSGIFKDTSESFINIGDSWKRVSETYVKVGDTWKQESILEAPQILTVPVSENLKNQLDAGAGVTKDGSDLVSYWADQSGSGNDVFESNPTYQPLWVSSSAFNSKPIIRFSAHRLRYVQNTLVRNVDAVHIFYVLRFNASGSDQVLFTAATPTNTYRFHVRVNTSDYIYLGGRRLDGDSFNSYIPTTWTMSTSTNYIFDIKSLYKDQTVHFKTNDLYTELSSSIYSSAGSTSDTDSDGIYLGSASAYNLPLQADVAEILIYDRELSDFETNEVKKYLSYKYF